MVQFVKIQNNTCTTEVNINGDTTTLVTIIQKYRQKTNVITAMKKVWKCDLN